MVTESIGTISVIYHIITYLVGGDNIVILEALDLMSYTILGNCLILHLQILCKGNYLGVLIA